MSLVPFINTLGDDLEEGDVVVIAAQSSPRDTPEGLPLPEVDLTEAVYDPRVCGVVSFVRVDLAPPPAEGGEAVPAPEAPKPAAKGKRGAKSKAAESETPEPTQPLAASVEELAAIDHSKVGPGQIGFMQTHGAFSHCKVDADIAPIEVGDLLTTSPTRGHAQKVEDPARASGAILGKALGSLRKGRGKIPIIVTL